MEKETTEVGSWAMPAVRVMLEKMGYELIGTVLVTVTRNTSFPYTTPMLYARPMCEGEPHVVIMLGDIAWDTEGYDAFIDFKIFEVGDVQPETLDYYSVKAMSLHWSWKERYGYNEGAFGDHSIKSESVYWQPLIIIGYR